MASLNLTISTLFFCKRKSTACTKTDDKLTILTAVLQFQRPYRNVRHFKLLQWQVQ